MKEREEEHFEDSGPERYPKINYGIYSYRTNPHDYEYISLVCRILQQGEERDDRTGVGTYSLFGEQIRFDLQEGFPLLTSKEMYFKGIKAELLWFLSGSTNVYSLPEYIQHWWEPFADENGELGPIYGHQLRNFANLVDQVMRCLSNMEENPYSRRHIITTWNPTDISDMGLPPCHGLIQQFYIREDEFLDMQMYQRSADVGIGLPVNIASYALLLSIFAEILDLDPGMLYISLGDSHIYKNHADKLAEQVQRDVHEPPELNITKDISCLPELTTATTPDNFQIENYRHEPKIDLELNT